MKYVAVFSLVTLLAVCVVRAKPAVDFKNMGKDLMNMAKTAMKAMKSFKPEDIKELQNNLKDPAEKKAFMAVIQAMMQGKSQEDMMNILMETQSGPLLAEKMLPILESYQDLQEKYGQAFKTVANQKQG